MIERVPLEHRELPCGEIPNISLEVCQVSTVNFYPHSHILFLLPLQQYVGVRDPT